MCTEIIAGVSASNKLPTSWSCQLQNLPEVWIKYFQTGATSISKPEPKIPGRADLSPVCLAQSAQAPHPSEPGRGEIPVGPFPQICSFPCAHPTSSFIPKLFYSFPKTPILQLSAAFWSVFTQLLRPLPAAAHEDAPGEQHKHHESRCGFWGHSDQSERLFL